MKPDWDALSAEFKDSQEVLIADVDCTADGNRVLCQKHGVQGYPTIKMFGPDEEEGVAYNGGRDLSSLRKVAQELGPSCSFSRKELCTPDQLTKLEKYAAKSQAWRDGKIAKLTKELAEKEMKHKELQMLVSTEYEVSKAEHEKVIKQYSLPIKLLTAATPGAEKYRGPRVEALKSAGSAQDAASGDAVTAKSQDSVKVKGKDSVKVKVEAKPEGGAVEAASEKVSYRPVVTNEIGHIRKLFSGMGPDGMMAKYADPVIENGVVMMEDLISMSDEDLRQLADAAGMSIGHRQRLVNFVKHIRQTQQDLRENTMLSGSR